jgi:hypothetical protein
MGPDTHLGVEARIEIYTADPMASHTSRRDHGPQMNATATRDELRRHLDLAERWDSSAGGDALFSHCSDLLLAARALEAAASAAPADGLNPAVLGCFGAALDSLGTVSLLLDRARGADAQDSGSEDGQADPARLLFAINQNLRFAADAAELGRRVLTDPDGGKE